MNRLPPTRHLSERTALRAAAWAPAITADSRPYLSDARAAAEPVVAGNDDAHAVSVTPLIGDRFDGSTVMVSASATMQLK